MQIRVVLVDVVAVITSSTIGDITPFIPFKVSGRFGGICNLVVGVIQERNWNEEGRKMSPLSLFFTLVFRKIN
jgi:hypothetical protein